MSPPATPPADDIDRPQDPLEYERGFWGRGLMVAGVDEVGRGPLSGPVVAAAVILPEDCVIEGATDSKRLNAVRRETLAEEIFAKAVAVRIGAASVHEIDRSNILVCTGWAMTRALDGLSVVPDHVVVDGLPMKSLRWKHEAVVRGDGSIHCISCASIVAKVCRDRLMRKLSVRYPGFGWESNVGYGTREHREAIAELGPTPHHRRTFLGLQHDLF